ncbi:MAG: PAS domain S-box-containing protein [Candidatus Promineifilaceae bacterium]|jgi:PAS domain S-box-containing protein
MRIKTKTRLLITGAIGLPLVVASGVFLAVIHADRFSEDLAACDNMGRITQTLQSLLQRQDESRPLEHPDRWRDASDAMALAIQHSTSRNGQLDVAAAAKAQRRLQSGLNTPSGVPAFNTIEEALNTLGDETRNQKQELNDRYRHVTRVIGTTVIGVITLLALVAGLVAFCAGRRLARRVERIFEGMQAVADGDFDHRINLTPKDELTDLADAFDKIAERLRETLDRKEQLTKELTVHEIAEEEIHRTQDLTRLWLNSCTDGVWDWLLTDDFEYMSPRFWEVFGIDPKTQPHHPSAWQEIIHKDDVQKMTDALEKHVLSKGETPFREEIRFHHRDGHIVWVLTRGQVIEWHPDGQPKRMVGTHTDITRTKSAERRERETHEVLSAVLDQSPDSVLVTNLNGEYTLVNTIAASRFEKSLDDILGKTATSLFSEQDALHRQQLDRSIIATGDAKTFEESLTIGGRHMTMLTTKAPFLDSHGKTVGLITMSRDISELSAARQTLFLRSEELESSNSELEQFAYIASHDLQEPLRKISTFAELLVDTDKERLSDEGREFLRFMQNAAQRMQTLVQDLLEISRVTIRSNPFEPVDLQKLCSDVLIDLEFAIEDAAARVELKPLPVIDADASQLRQLLQNLIGNAIKFRRPDVPVTVCIEPDTTREDDNVTFLVSDNGIGFDEKHSDRIFGIFQRLHAKHAYSGSGIGLAICRKIVDRHHGTISVQSQPGDGTTFSVTLPRQQQKSNDGAS